MNDSTATYSQMFSGKRLLIVEDEYLLAEEPRRRLRELGCVLIGPTGDIKRALELIGDADAAILDIQFDPEAVFPVVEALERLGLPYVFATGDIPPAKFTGFVLCDKAVEIEHIAKALFGGRKLDT
ncbi:response regulator [Rhizobium sp. RCC_161_2]|uniref:response regulator n=1 Tax=Rhizobium sp. RCC_161_2 TaxID=3239219 RepID=UPI0035255AC7